MAESEAATRSCTAAPVSSTRSRSARSSTASGRSRRRCCRAAGRLSPAASAALLRRAWLMMVSMQMVVFPVDRSPMMVPRPIGRDHGVDWHDARLHRLPDGPALDDPGRELLHRIRGVADDGPLPIERFTERVDDPRRSPLPTGTCSSLPVANFVSFLQLRVVAKMMTPTSVSSRFNARPVMPLPKSSISFSMTSARPSTLAAPSPISRMTPTVFFPAAAFAQDLGFDFLEPNQP